MHRCIHYLHSSKGQWLNKQANNQTYSYIYIYLHTCIWTQCLFVDVNAFKDFVETLLLKRNSSNNPEFCERDLFICCSLWCLSPVHQCLIAQELSRQVWPQSSLRHPGRAGSKQPGLAFVTLMCMLIMVHRGYSWWLMLINCMLCHLNNGESS